MNVEKMRRPALLVVVVAVVGLVAAYTLSGSRGTNTGTGATQMSNLPRGMQATRNIDPVAFQKGMRELWTDHMQWTYATVNAFFHNPEAVEAHLNRLLRNQQEIGAAFVPFFGQEAGDQLAALLTVHIQQAVPVLQAAQAGDEAALESALADWYANANEIANLISALNPKVWPRSVMEEIWKVHIDQTTAYSLDLLNGDYEAAIEHFDEAFDHIMGLADILSAGIIEQFPRQFTR